MSAPRNAARNTANAAGREIARGLVGALRAALEPGAPERARAVARDVAQVMGLDGLDAVLAELGRASEAARPADLAHVAARLARLAEEAEREESPDPFRAADAELTAHAMALRETEWSGAGASAVPVYAAAEVLADLPLEPNADLSRARLTAPVAASLRAALDWIGADEALLVQAGVHDSALALTSPVSHAGGLGPAGAVLASVEGSLAPEPDGRWTLRVPLHVERPSFLLLRVGHVPVALPWHAVARLRMLAPAAWAELGEPVLEPLVAPQPGGDDRPGALVALGLTHAWLVADRIVWRIAITPEDVEKRGPFGASSRAVRVESGEHYWVLEPAWLLRNATPTPVAPPAPRPRPVAAAPAEPIVPEAPPETAPAISAEPPAADAAALADAVARAVKAIDPGLILLAPVLSELHAAGARAGLRVAGEVFADRAYTDKGTLVPRGQPGAVIHDHDELVTHVLRMLEAGGVVSQSGKVLPTSMDSICVHGDTLGAVESARHLRTELEARGWTIAPLPQLS